MKKYILLLSLFAIAMAAQSQTLVLVDGDTIDFKNKAFTITTNSNRVSFVTNDTVLTFDIRELSTLRFALSYSTGVSELDADETAILYDEENERVVVHNGDSNATLNIFDSKGALVKSTQGCETGLQELQPGIYIISYNKELNVKILKK